MSKFLCGYVFNSPGCIHRVEWLDHMTNSRLNLLKNCPHCLPKESHHFTFQPPVHEAFNVFVSSPALTVACIFLLYSSYCVWNGISLEPWICISLMANDVVNLKTASYFTSKMDLFGNSRELQFRICKLWQNYRQFQQIKEKNIILWRRRKKLGGVVLNKKPLGEEQRFQGDNGFLLAKSLE